MSGYVHGASTADPIRRAAHMIQALRYQLAQKDVELQAAHAHAEKLRARLDRHENPPRHWGRGTSGCGRRHRKWPTGNAGTRHAPRSASAATRPSGNSEKNTTNLHYHKERHDD